MAHRALTSAEIQPLLEDWLQELLVDGSPVPLPDAVADLLTSIQLDFGDIPPECQSICGRRVRANTIRI